MHVVVTGAGGFVGRALMQRLLDDPHALPSPLSPLSRLTGIDQHFAPNTHHWRVDKRVNLLEGDFADPALLSQALSSPPDCVFHLASVPGSLAERDQALGHRVNLMACISLLQALAKPDVASAAPAPRVVFASSVAVYGSLPASGMVDESQPAQPTLAYGAHKLMAEVLLADLSRQGRLDGISLRLPGIVARPPAITGHGSAFMSDLIRRGLAGLDYDCPVSPQAQSWWMSLPCCIDNLLHAARLPGQSLAAGRTVQLPVITATAGALVAAIESETGQSFSVRYVPDERIENLFGRLPQLSTPLARSLGFTDDGSLGQLIRQATSLD